MILEVENPNQILWPETGFTKGDLVDYYTAIAPVLLPHLAGRAVKLARFPNGVDRPGWFPANVPDKPDWLPVARVKGKRGQELRYAVVNDLRSLVWVANLAAIELHPFLATAERPLEATALVFDVAPGPPATVLDGARVALHVRERLKKRGLTAFVKTSGARGLHVCAPLASGQRFDETRTLAKAVARELAKADRTLVIERVSPAERKGKVFLDWGQNDASRALLAPYSLRATRHPLVSTPLEWSELEAALERNSPRSLGFLADATLVRVKARGDLFAPLLYR
ncbi:MAG TPA: non-homologous end-joining DNA ligase [Planctomycetota bacterium]|nr:non-homologous end-joining DNA ligase [Planctomycetota bacterium]